MFIIIASLLGMIATAFCVWGCWQLRGTTLAAPCAWAAGSLGVVTCHVALMALPDKASANIPWPHLHYLAGITTVAPFVALLGAKRPQSRAWQLIVASLIALLAFQDLRSWSIDPAVAPTPHTAWQCLLAVLVVAQWLNYLPTRYAAAACLALAGQAGLLAGSLSFLPERNDSLLAAGVSMLGLAPIVTAVCRRRLAASGLRRQGETLPDVRWQRAWLEFRDLYGVLWSLRVAERVNAIAREQSCSMRLTWRGFQRINAAEAAIHDVPADEALFKACKAVLARFLASRWFAQRGL